MARQRGGPTRCQDAGETACDALVRKGAPEAGRSTAAGAPRRKDQEARVCSAWASSFPWLED